jgi:hypothetical protein
MNTKISDAGGKLIRAYALAVSYPDQVPSFVADQRQSFQADGEVVRYGKLLAAQLRGGALSGPAPHEVREQAADLAGRVGAGQLAGPLADGLMANMTDLMLLADYVSALLETLPALAAGDLQPYRHTLLYQSMSLLWNNAAALLGVAGVEPIRQLSLQLNEWYVGNLVMALGVPPAADEVSETKLRALLQQAVDELRGLSGSEASVQAVVWASVLLGAAAKHGDMLDLPESEAQAMTGLENVGRLVDWLEEHGWVE